MKIETFTQSVKDMQQKTRSYFKTEEFTIRTTFWATSLGGPLAGVSARLLQIILLILPLCILGVFFTLVGIEGFENPHDSMSVPASIGAMLFGLSFIGGGLFFFSAIFQTLEIDILHKRVKRYRLFVPIQTLNFEDIAGVSSRGLVYKSLFLGYHLMLTTCDGEHVPVLTVKNKDERDRFVSLLEAIIAHGMGNRLR